ncbi:hypothetical protein [Flavobacterium aestivum]|uniref:hypothetical protein n=1 Tax=Flavobacterium aestivum TaxID=3003257 RepID=UPI0024824A39|nr:hypothetical protein [Flavobacterium aestivum]
MKKFKLQSILFVFFAATVLTSCNKDDDSPSTPELITKNTFVTDVNGPTTGKVDETITLNVLFTVDNSCGDFNKFIDVTIDKEKGLQVQAKYPSAICDKRVPEPKTTTYKFKSSTKGSYQVKFRKSETEFKTHTIVIN